MAMLVWALLISVCTWLSASQSDPIKLPTPSPTLKVESFLDKCKWKRTNVKSTFDCGIEETCKKECEPCVEHGAYDKVTRPVCELSEGECIYQQIQARIIEKREVKVINQFKCHYCVDNPNMGTCETPVPSLGRCDYTDCNSDCEPCNGRKKTIKMKEFDIVTSDCYIDCDGFCRADEKQYDKDGNRVKDKDNKEVTLAVPCVRKPSATRSTCIPEDKTIILVSEPMTHFDAQVYCAVTYGTDLASVHDDEIVQATALLSEAGIMDNAWIGLFNTIYGGWFEWTDGSCCDNVYGLCTDGSRWVNGEPTKNCLHHPGSDYVNMDVDGYINNDFEGGKVLPFFCNCPEKEILPCV